MQKTLPAMSLSVSPLTDNGIGVLAPAYRTRIQTQIYVTVKSAT